MTSLPDPTRIPDHAWEFEKLSEDGLRRHYVHWIDKAKGLGFRKTENIVEDQLLAENRELLNESYGKRFRDDAVGTLIYREPLNKFFEPRNIKALKEGDADYIKWKINHEKNRPYRTFRGKV